jgi:hypothetical protein
MRQQHPGELTLLGYLYDAEIDLSKILGYFHVEFAPVDLRGDVANPGFYNVPNQLPVTTESVTYKSGTTPVMDTYTGTTLWNFLNTAGGGVDTTTAKNDILSKYVIATGSDGYTAVYSLGEIDPQFGHQQILIASSDTAGQLGPSGADGLSRVVVPGDIAGGRYVSDLVSLTVGSLPEPGPAGPGGFSRSATISGAVEDPLVITPKTLSKLIGQTLTETATYQSAGTPVTDTYTGVSLWDLIQDSGVLTDASIKNDILNFVVVATGSDGYRAVFSMGEIDPAFGSQQDIVAYSDTGGQLGRNGPDGALRIVVPGDTAGGRYVSNLTSLQVVNVVTGHVV